MLQTAKTEDRSSHEYYLEKISGLFKTGTEIFAKIAGNKCIDLNLLTDLRSMPCASLHQLATYDDALHGQIRAR